MKKINYRCFFTFLFLSILYAQPIFDLPDDSASFGILICDYETSEFEEGTVLNVPFCNGCDSTGFPFDIFFQSPGDFGWIQFNYTETNDTIFYATIIWMGTGEISFPDTFLPADSFAVENEYANDPETILFWHDNGLTLEENTLLASAENAYDYIRILSIVHQFAESPYQILAYLYTPTVGMTDWSVAKWIFFLYRNPEVISVKDENQIPQKFKLYQPYPNPFNPTTTIRFNIPAETLHATSLRVFDITGRLVETLVSGEIVAGEHEVFWNADSHPSGVYFVRMESISFVENQKVVLMK